MSESSRVYWKGLVRRQGLGLCPGFQPAVTLGKLLDLWGSPRAHVLHAVVMENKFTYGILKALGLIYKKFCKQCKATINPWLPHFCASVVYFGNLLWDEVRTLALLAVSSPTMSPRSKVRNWRSRPLTLRTGIGWGKRQEAQDQGDSRLWNSLTGGMLSAFLFRQASGLQIQNISRYRWHMEENRHVSLQSKCSHVHTCMRAHAHLPPARKAKI